jgi:gamma-glutamyltranspeptidase/glutathione hydrolase
MEYYDYTQPFASRRSPVMGMRGAVATSHPLAAQAGIRMLLAGGNAVDAAIATAAALVVLEPTSCGLGGDAFAIVWDNGEMHGLNASGRGPEGLSAEKFRRAGMTKMPTDGWAPVTVPGVVSAWSALSRRFGCLPLREVMMPAVEYAREGAPVPPVIAGYWGAAETRFGGRGGVFAEFEHAFLPGGRAPRPGEVYRNPELAVTLQSIAESHGESFYRGNLARAIAAHSEATGGYLTLRDLAEHLPEWVEPVKARYRGFEVWEIPPNGQGIVALMALNIMEGFDLCDAPRLAPESLHVIIEALRLAFADAHAYVGDPRAVTVPVHELLSPEYAAARRGQISTSRAMTSVAPGRLYGKQEMWEPLDGDTVYLCTADWEGMMVSYIQSNYMGFGSGVVVPDTGIAMQNRGAGFSLEEGHPNELVPGRRPFHTIIPGFLTQSGVPLAAFGVMGGDMQPQGHVQVISSIIDHSLNPQAAMDCPRVRIVGAAGVLAEPEVGDDTIAALRRLGHSIRAEEGRAGFGGGQMVWRNPDTGVLIAGSEPRKDGCAVAI